MNEIENSNLNTSISIIKFILKQIFTYLSCVAPKGDTLKIDGNDKEKKTNFANSFLLCESVCFLKV